MDNEGREIVQADGASRLRLGEIAHEIEQAPNVTLEGFAAEIDIEPATLRLHMQDYLNKKGAS